MKSALPWPRGYFAIGVEGISKPVNLGNLLRSAHSFGASFVFTIAADPRALEMRSDTSRTETHVPLYHWRDLAELALPKGCSLVGIEMLEEAADLPKLSPSVAGRLRARTGARRAHAGACRSLPASRAHPHRLLPQCRDRRRNRHVRPIAFSRPLWLPPGGRRSRGRAPRPHIQGGPKRVRRVDRPFSPKEN